MGLMNRREGDDKPRSHTAFRRAVLDIGSNTVRVVVYGGAPRAPTVLWNEKVSARLGETVASEGTLSEESMVLALRGIERFVLLFRDLKVTHVETVATEAVRRASNGTAFLDRVRDLGLTPRILSGQEEGEVSASGVIGAFPGMSGIVADLGGGSLELVAVDEATINDTVSLPLGTLPLAQMRERHGHDTRKMVAQVLKGAQWSVPAGGSLYLVGGTFRAMSVYALEQLDYPLSDPHGLSLPAKRAKELAEELAKASPNDLARSDRISSMRAHKLPDAAYLLIALLKRLQPERIIVSAWGLREGLLMRSLSPHERSRDPLLAGIAEFGAHHNASPTMAARIAGWTAGAIRQPGRGSERIRLAAITLALSAMQIEPNIRLRQALDWALHKRWIALAPHERAMIAATICANGNQCDLPSEITSLAPPEDLAEAIEWGLALRLCRRLSGASNESLQNTALNIEGNTLVLRMTKDRAPLFGAPNEKDLRLLAGRLGLAFVMEANLDTASSK